MRALILAGFLAASATPVLAAPPASLLKAEEQANEICRGESGDSPVSAKGCDIRDYLVGELKAKGWCYRGRTPDAPTSDFEWLRCR